MQRTWLLLWLVIAASNAAAAADTYVVMSLIGDRVTVIASEKQVGSNFDLNRQQVMAVDGRSLDDYAARVADATIERARPSASVTMLRANDPALYALRNSWLDADAVDVKTLVSTVAPFVPPASDARLLLITPYRAELELKTDRGYAFTGSKVAGLGFFAGAGSQTYADREIGAAFLGVFANFQLLLINLQTKAVDAHERVTAGDTYSSSLAPDRNPLNALSDAKKTEALQELMKREIERVLPGMLSSTKS
jgi:hypothetical protein